MTINELKEYIYNENKIEYILEQLDCHEIKRNDQKGYISAAHKDGDNPMGICIRNNEYLNYRSFSRGINYEDGQDLISLVETTKKMSFIEAVKYIHTILDLPFEFKRKQEKPKEKYDPLQVFKKVLRCNRAIVNVDDIKILEDKILNDYVPLLHYSWITEGITERTRKKFNIAYSYRRKRIIIPHYYWMTHELIGVQARTTIENYEEFSIPKYLLTSGLDKSLNIYGYCQNKDEIERRGYCCLYESEKSVLKRDSRNDPTGLALSGKFISEEQVRIILSLNINEIVVAIDNDVSEEEIWHICEKFYKIRKVSYIKDNWDLLGKKDCAADMPMKIFDFLFKYRTVYDEALHKKYQESLKK